MRWQLGRAPWVLHSAPLLGNLTSRWIETQAQATNRYDSRLLGGKIAPDARRQPHWLYAGDRLDLWLAYKGLFKSGGVSGTWLARQLKGNPPAVIHAHYGPPAAQHRHLARVLRSGLVTSFYGYDATQWEYSEKWIWRKRYGRLFRDGDAFVAEGPAMAQRLIGLGCPEEKVHVIRLPADSEGLEGCRRPKADEFLVAVAGWFGEKKGFDIAVKAFARALRSRADARLLMLGGGPLEPMLRELVAKAGLEAQVTWAGVQPFEQFMGAMSTACVALYPSRRAENGDSEGGAPVTLIEAQWLGVPSIVSQHDDLPFVAAPEGSIVLPPERVELWADALRSLYEDPARVAFMGAEASRFAQRHHSPSSNAAGREALYAAVTTSA